MPRCNLATYLLGEGKIEEALALITPLSDVMELHVQEMAFLSYVRARINIERKEYDQARNTLETALEIYPDYEFAQYLLDHLDRVEMFARASEGWGRWQEQQHQRNLARRERQRTQLTTPNPTLNETLGL